MSTASPPPARFTEHELALLAKTADALTAYLGKPILAEVGVAENGCEWAAYARPLGPAETLGEDDLRMQLGGPGARWLGNTGGLAPGPDETYDCLYLWAIQINDQAGERFIKLDHVGDSYGSSDDLTDLLPFALDETADQAQEKMQEKKTQEGAKSHLDFSPHPQ